MVESTVVDESAGTALQQAVQVGGGECAVGNGGARFCGADDGEVNPWVLVLGPEDIVFDVVEAIGFSGQFDPFYLPRITAVEGGDTAEGVVVEDELDGVGVIGVDPVGHGF